MRLFALGINHHTAPLSVREQVAFHPERVNEALNQLVQGCLVGEVAIFFICNRIELYCAINDP